MKLLLVASDYRRQFAKDILAAVAAPDGLILQYRYRPEDIPEAVHQAVVDRTAVEAEAMLCFVSRLSGDHPFFLPVRLAKVVDAQLRGGTYLFKLSVGGYIDPQRRSLTWEELCRETPDVIAALTGQSRPEAVRPVQIIQRLPPSVSAVDSLDAWNETVRRLAQHPAYAETFFLKVELAAVPVDRQVRIGSDGQLEVEDGQSFKFIADIYAHQYRPEVLWRLSCKTGGSNLRVVSHDSQDIELIHDAVEFWVAPQAPRTSVHSLVTLDLARTDGDPSGVDTLLRLPVVIRPSSHRLAGRIFVTGIAALLVALPAVLGDGTPMWLRIALAILGAGLLATASTLLGDNTSRGS